MSPPHAAVQAPENPDRIDSADGGLWKSILRILHLLARPELAKWRPVMAIAVIITLAASVLEVVSPLVMGNAINQAAGADGTVANFATAALWLLYGLGLRFAAAALPQLRDWLFSPVSQDAQRVASVDAFGHALALSLGFHQTRRTGALNRIIERGAGAIDYLIRFLAFNIGPTLVRLVLASIALGLAYDIRLSLIAVATIVVYVICTVIITEWRVRQRRRMNEADTHFRATSVDILTNFETVKSFAAETRETRRFDGAMGEYNRHYVETTRSMYLLNAVQALVMNAGLLAVMLLSAWNVIQGTMKIGDLTGVMLMLLSLYAPLNILGWAWREIKQGAVDLEKLHGLMAMVPEVRDAPGATVLERPQGRVTFEEVAFSHEGRAVGVSGISFDVAPGRKVAFVGTSGAGKSTLLKLLFRFYDVDTGTVRVDGHDVRGLTQESLRASLGLVPQDVVLFNDTLRANIAYARPGANEAELRDAARRAQLLPFIEALPEGWNTRVGERGLKLSGGEKQRVGIARVILANPAILVLDEATSALDSATEAAVQGALDEASAGRTTLMVAHRLSTVISADEIIVLEAGRVVERGTHEALLAKGGKYADMWDRQAHRAEPAEVLS
ncbi:ABC transporter ATP-binding protein/permease [Hyphomonas sp. WL0036]|uniref:ABCB family ABC transporter ATP-binding protein/permease n=1 Tax=Hyphomonas sediminis TaxID=2866160 RepID=UPI001C7FF53C|nr:ABC transporter ATP-binding protein/permease [Hyphomonas sediminis]MBY9067214.1 ABC transporter ATP-binding protein/permease [Hyphomonas sediminis]